MLPYLPDCELPPADGIPAMITVGDLYYRIKKLSPIHAEKLYADFKDVFDYILLDWCIKSDRIVCDISLSANVEKAVKFTLADSMYKYDLTWRQSYIYALSQLGYINADIARHLKVPAGGVSRTLKDVRTKIFKFKGWYDDEN